ncbi:Sec62 family protein translocation protein [Natrinema sp. CBA1119]|uniref:Sec62 family protein translocation protein n=1 Tax=Natrinema sp. CBA1119 TaxID=1608465 RepID=UPI0020D2767E|nr:Sec62 family protein translocation protein [Natrinema sp. CBA1119]
MVPRPNDRPLEAGEMMLEHALLPLQTDAGDLMMYYLIGALVLLLITIGVAYWVYKDASKRANNELLWTIGVAGLLFLFPPLGIIALIIYVVIRSDVTSGEPSQDGAVSSEW